MQQSALRLLAECEHSTAELRRKLQARGHDPEAVGQALMERGQTTVFCELPNL